MNSIETLKQKEKIEQEIHLLQLQLQNDYPCVYTSIDDEDVIYYTGYRRYIYYPTDLMHLLKNKFLNLSSIKHYISQSSNKVISLLFEKEQIKNEIHMLTELAAIILEKEKNMNIKYSHKFNFQDVQKILQEKYLRNQEIEHQIIAFL